MASSNQGGNTTNNGLAYLRFGCTEINGAQAWEYITKNECRVSGGKQPPAILYQNPDTGVPRVFTNPIADGAPWYHAEFPESADFLGIFIHRMTGFGSTFVRRIESRLAGSGGGVHGPLRSAERQIGFKALAVAKSQAGMEYGLRWFTDVLKGDGCDPCGTCDAEVRLAVPPDAYPDVAKWTLKNVAALEGPFTEDGPVDGMASIARNWVWTMASEFPYLFKCPEVVLPTTNPLPSSACVPICNWLNDYVVETGLLSSPTGVGDTAAVITIYAGTNDVYARLVGRAQGVVPLAALDPKAVPTGHEVFDVNVFIPQSCTLVYDASVRQITMTMPGGDVEDGLRYITVPEGSVPCYPAVRCGTIKLDVVMSLCVVNTKTSVAIDSVYRVL